MIAIWMYGWIYTYINIYGLAEREGLGERERDREREREKENGEREHGER